jgi:ketosteroid isomerase-like protein
MSEALKAEITKLEDARYKAMIDKDYAGLDRLLADSLIYTHSSAVVDTKANWIDGMKAGKYDYRSAERTDVAMQVCGDAVVVTGRAEMQIFSGGNPRTLRNRFINVWAKGAKGWQMVAWQSTPIPA